jgi:hypothetical protein
LIPVEFRPSLYYTYSVLGEKRREEDHGEKDHHSSGFSEGYGRDNHGCVWRAE